MAKRKATPIAPAIPAAPPVPWTQALVLQMVQSKALSATTPTHSPDPEWRKYASGQEPHEVLWAISRFGDDMVHLMVVTAFCKQYIFEPINTAADPDAALALVYKGATGVRNQIIHGLVNAYWRHNSTSGWAEAYKHEVWRALADLAESFIPSLLAAFEAEPRVEGFDAERLATLAAEAKYGYDIGGLNLSTPRRYPGRQSGVDRGA